MGDPWWDDETGPAPGPGWTDEDLEALMVAQLAAILEAQREALLRQIERN